MRVVIVGGGIAGLATAALLGKDGHEVTVLEAQDSVGGRAGSWESDGFRFDTGPSWYLMPEVFDRFFAEVGTTTADELTLTRLEPAYRVYFEGDPEPVDVDSGVAEAAALFDRIEPGAGAALTRYLDSAGDAYRLATSRFLYDSYDSLRSLSDPSLLKRLPQLLPLLTQSLQRYIARRFRHPRLRQILGYPAVFLGGTPEGVPALYHLMSHLDLADGVAYPQGGFTELIARVAAAAERHGAQILTGTPVSSITTRDGAARGVVTAEGTSFDADVVVAAADLHHVETALLSEADRSYPERWWRGRTPSPGALLLLLGVSGPLDELAHHTLLFTEDWERNFATIGARIPAIPDPASIYVCRPSATDPTVAPEGHENLFVLVPVPSEPVIGVGGTNGEGDPYVEAAADAVIAQLARWCGIPDLANRIVVRRTIAPGDFEADLHAWRGNSLGLAHTLAQSAMFRPHNRSRRVSGLYYAGSSVLPGVGLPLCLISAEITRGLIRNDVTDR